MTVKYHYFVFVLPPWTGIVGDGIMLGAGHESISLVRIMPILFASNYADMLRWVLPAKGQLELSEIIDE